MNRKQKIGLAAALILLVFLLIWLWLVRERPSSPPWPPEEAAEETAVSELEPLPPAPAPANGLSREATSSLQSLAKTFAERYGSFSTQGNFANLEDLLPMMTPSLAEQTRAYIESAPAPAEFYGVTTKVVSVQILNLDESAGSAVLRLSTQRQEALGGPQNPIIKYQDLLLNFERTAGTWKISSAVWQ